MRLLCRDIHRFVAIMDIMSLRPKKLSSLDHSQRTAFRYERNNLHAWRAVISRMSCSVPRTHALIANRPSDRTASVLYIFALRSGPHFFQNP
jgi:hypothetical protein